MNVIELAKALGEGIKNDPILLAYDAAKAAYEADGELVEKMKEYSVQRACLAEEFNKDLDVQDKGVIESLKKAMDALGREIAQNEHYLAFAAAESEVNDLMKRINSTISYHAFGILPQSECTHDCSTCGGCH